MALPAVLWGVGNAAVWGYRAYQGYRAVRTVQAAAAATQAVVTADRARRAAELARAAAAAQSLSQAATRDKPCEDCEPDPCAHLANGIPGSRYRGGAHGSMALPVGDGLDSHHTPASAASPLPRAMGPAFQMEPADHWMTASNGRMPGHQQYIAAQRGLVNSGNFMGATAMDVADVRAKFGDKYDGAIAQMMAYTSCLKKNGIIK